MKHVAMENRLYPFRELLAQNVRLQFYNGLRFVIRRVSKLVEGE